MLKILGRILGYLAASGLIAWFVGWRMVEGCLADHAQGDDGGLCGVGWVFSAPVFLATLVLLVLVVELTLVRRRRAAADALTVELR